jgi:hypothetical protein
VLDVDTRTIAIATPALLLVAIVVVVLAVRGNEAAPTPAGTVRDFIATGVVGQDDGYEPCSYLTSGEQHSVSATAGDVGCSQALAHAELRLGDGRVVTQSALRRLTITTPRTSGDRAWVRVSGPGGSATFALARRDAAERREADAP